MFKLFLQIDPPQTSSTHIPVSTKKKKATSISIGHCRPNVAGQMSVGHSPTSSKCHNYYKHCYDQCIQKDTLTVSTRIVGMSLNLF